MNVMSKRTPKAQSKRTEKPLPSEKNDNHAEMRTTAIVIPKDMWNLLRQVAFHRAQTSGGRASVSEVLRTLVEKHRTELKRELG